MAVLKHFSLTKQFFLNVPKASGSIFWAYYCPRLPVHLKITHFNKKKKKLYWNKVVFISKAYFCTAEAHGSKISNITAEKYLGKQKMGVDGVDSHQSENGKRPHDKNAGIVFYASYLHSYICAQEESNKQQFVD